MAADEASETMQLDGGRGATLRALRVAGLASLAFVVVASASLVESSRYGLRGFGTPELSAKLSGLWLLGWVPTGAALSVAFAITALHHANGATKRPLRTALLAGLSVPMAALPVAAIAFATGYALTRWVHGGPAREIFVILERDDVVHGLWRALQLGVGPAAWSLFGTKITRSRGRGLGAKLAINWLAFAAAAMAMSSARSCLDAAGSDVETSAPPSVEELRDLAADAGPCGGGR